MLHEPGPEGAFSRIDDSMARARTLHLAEGILIGLRRCSPEQAIAELVSAGREAGLSTYALARGLVLAAGGYRDTTVDPAARVAEHRWGALFRRPSAPQSDVPRAAPTSMA
ncbi:hypothetical protein [Mycolicibacterium frederiksbergense]|uniref:ANTAR domain-containing protein n=1 Tax=Mycolicibacterium frederiksbergense TaxID=117567 RepID=A0A6H0SD77_9MYCO|nr:hypothetical protein [Mycolicibacterium frederiksbergense]QIV84265.1 hypothetical protein EXE63_27850 [Mycolicibacterium frederiksbergense]